jgi:hypothetical protein
MQAWQILAAARFVQGRETEALDAWNRRQEPRVDLTRVDGLDRTRHDVVTDIVEPAPGEILTSRELERARRRVGALPAMQTSRVVYAPRADGRAMIDVVVVEKPVLAHGWPSVTAMAVDAFVAREVRLQAANLTGDGELWMGSWRWWAGRPRVSFGLAVPRMFATSGLWRIDGSWEEASYRLTNDNSDVMFAQTERRGARVSFSDWATSDTRWEVRGGLDRWSDRGTHVFAGANIERRWVEDRLALRVDSTVWRAVDRPLTMMFASSGVSLRFRSAAEPGATWSGSAGLYAASAHAPLDRWPTADTGQVSHLLLRAHPLLDAGAIPTPDLSPRLAHATLELQRPLAIRLPTRIWWAAFVDAAQRGASAEHPRSAALVDVGLGLRVNVPGTRQFLRLDVARSLSDGRVAVSAGWQSAWGDQ